MSNSCSKKITNNYWKLNKCLLEDKHFIKEAGDIITKFWRQTCINGNVGLSWELMKFEIRNLAIHIGKTKAKMKQKYELEIITSILNLSKKSDLSSQEITELSKLQIQLDKIYEEKAKGAFIKWMEHGEKNSKYFFRKEKKRNVIS